MRICAHVRPYHLIVHMTKRKLSKAAIDDSGNAVKVRSIKNEVLSNDTVKQEMPSPGLPESSLSNHLTDTAAAPSMPKHWEEVYHKIFEYRKHHEAPVDTMGCDAHSEDLDPALRRFHVLVSLMLSSQTKDQITTQAMGRLRRHGLSINGIIETDLKTLDNLINPVGFHSRKANFIKQTAQILKEKFNSDVPNNLEDLLSLPGVGPKMAYLTLKVAWNNVIGIGVDVHMHRICRRLGWTTSIIERKGPEETRKSLQSWLPRELWTDINKSFVGFGQVCCLPIKPKCPSCPVNHLCPSSTVKTKSSVLKLEKMESSKDIEDIF